MRRAGIILFVLGVVLTAFGTISGCGAFFAWNGRHPTAVHPIVLGTPLRAKIDAKAGRRYVVGVQVVFEREGLEERDGAVVVPAKLPLAAHIEDGSGVAVAKVTGWLDPSEPTTFLHGQAHAEGPRKPAELAAERLVGPYTAPADGAVPFQIDLGPDRVGTAKIREARAVVYDDALPAAIARAFAAAGVGALALVVGAVAFVIAILRSRRGGTRRRHFV
ncbi:MAG: hypothetical protein KF819_06390 [Labilithrix sp.]|nr:hypothetical protein [Labilithrix sp.]